MNSSALKFFTSPPLWVKWFVVSKDATGLMPDLPARRFCQNSCQPIPMEDTTPSPVMTTRSFMFHAEHKLRLGDLLLSDVRLPGHKGAGGKGFDAFDLQDQLVSRHDNAEEPRVDRSE